MVHAARRVRSRRPARRPHRLGAERRLARRLPQRRGRRRGAAADRRGGHAAGHRAARQLGRRGGRALRPLALRLARRPRARWPTRTSCAQLHDRDGVALPDALREHGVDLDHALAARSQLEGAAAYLELHIEQGPVLESMDLPLGVVLGTFGVERHRITWRGQAAHAGSTPMDQRRDALAGAAKLALEIREIAARVGGGAVCTSGGVVCRPGIVTSVVETAEQLLDQRHLDAAKLASMLAAGAARPASASRRRSRLEVEWERIWKIEPILFDETLIGFADEAIREVAGTSHRLPSGPLHDAAEVVACRRADRDDLRPEPPRPLAHEARGHEARAPRARGRGARPARGQDDRSGRVRPERRALAARRRRPSTATASCSRPRARWSLAEAELFARYGKVSRRRREARSLIGTSAYAGSARARAVARAAGARGAAGAGVAGTGRAAAARGGDRLSRSRGARPGVGGARADRGGVEHTAAARPGRAGLRRPRAVFDVVVTADQVPEPKPSPDVYLRACELLGASPSRSIGLEALRPASLPPAPQAMFVIGIPSFPGVLLDEADLVGGSLDDPASGRRSVSDGARGSGPPPRPAATSAMPSSLPGVIGFSSNPTQPKWSTASDAIACPARMNAKSVGCTELRRRDHARRGRRRRRGSRRPRPTMARRRSCPSPASRARRSASRSATRRRRRRTRRASLARGCRPRSRAVH